MNLFRYLKRLLPYSLFGRALLILMLPTLLVLAVATYMFYERHWSTVSRHMAASLAGEIALLEREYEDGDEQQRRELIRRADMLMNIRITPLENPNIRGPVVLSDSPYPDFANVLKTRLRKPFTIRDDEDENLFIRIDMQEGGLLMRVSEKRLISATTYIYLMWVAGTALVLMLIATLFLRNQIRPILRLAEAAESFGRGKDMPQFRPSGAKEVRRAAKAFIIMRERIKRQISTRTEMLAGISHDLRTPLTRMKLQLAMLGEGKEIRELQDDVSAMQHMIQEYLDFARGEGREESQISSLNELLSDIAGDFARQSQDVSLTLGSDVKLSLRPLAMRRCLTNLVENAVRYGKRAYVSTRVGADVVDIVIDDEGQGIPLEMREEVFKAFKRLDDARTPERGGVGLGLTIARDVALAHGGQIHFEDAPEGGLRVILRLPL